MQDPSGEPVKDAEFKAEVVLPDGFRRPVSLMHQDSQLRHFPADMQAPGDYAVEVTAYKKGSEVFSPK